MINLRFVFQRWKITKRQKNSDAWSLTICKANSQRSERWYRVRRQVVYRWARHNCGELFQSAGCRSVDRSRGHDRSYVLRLVPVPSRQFFFLLDEKWTWHFSCFVFVTWDSTSVSFLLVRQFLCVFSVSSLCCCHSHTGCCPNLSHTKISVPILLLLSWC